MVKEFKKFIMRGNMIDLAVGMIIGAAFNAIVTSLVNDIFMPLLAWIIGKPDFSDLFIVLGGDGKTAATLAEAQELGLTTWNYGSFITAVINFLLIAFVIFCLIKALNKMKDKIKKNEEADPTTKICPFCKSEIDIAATRCPHCTSQLDE